MHNRQVVFIASLLILLNSSARAADPSVRTVIPFDATWKFSLGDTPDAEKTEFSDTQWRILDVPHDWSIEGQISPQNPAGPAGAMLPAGIGWYRKIFDAPSNSADKKIYIEFDGVMMNSTVYINGEKLGTRPSGYQSFRYDLTGKLKPSANVLAVRCDNSLQPSSRWYAGSGINRHVRLLVMNPVHLEQWSTFITTPKVAPDGTATIHIETSIINQSPAVADVNLHIEILSPDGTSVQIVSSFGKSINPGASVPFSTDIALPRAQLWSIDSPKMYRALVCTFPAKGGGDGAGPRPLDDESIPFGIRTFEFKPETGFYLNGKNIKLYGVCLHADGGGIGTAVPMGVWRRRLTALRELGVNAIRTSHNAPDPEFLNLCDQMGFVVMHEIFDCWTVAKTRGDYARFFNDWWQRDLTDAVMRDRNHPCIILYSAGNEIHDSQDKQKEILPQLIALYHKLDPTRPVTQALFRPENPGAAYSNGIAEMLDVVGTNYRPNLLADLVKTHPQFKTIGTEDNYRPLELQVLRDSPSLSGEFLWTGIDYLGEGIGQSIAQGFGLLDRTNAPRFRAYEHQAWWVSAAEKPMVKIARNAGAPAGRGGERGGTDLMDWTPANAAQQSPQIVDVQSNCDQVELFLNGYSLGKQTRSANWSARTWHVPFAPGELKAIAYEGGKAVATDELHTAGPATKIKLTLDQPKLSPNWDDVAIVRAELVDAQGITNPNAVAKITFHLTGPGIIAAVDNADLDSHESFRGDSRTTYRGTCIALLKATAAAAESTPIKISASAEGLTDASATLETAP